MLRTAAQLGSSGKEGVWGGVARWQANRTADTVLGRRQPGINLKSRGNKFTNAQGATLCLDISEGLYFLMLNALYHYILILFPFSSVMRFPRPKLSAPSHQACFQQRQTAIYCGKSSEIYKHTVRCVSDSKQRLVCSWRTEWKEVYFSLSLDFYHQVANNATLNEQQCCFVCAEWATTISTLSVNFTRHVSTVLAACCIVDKKLPNAALSRSLNTQYNPLCATKVLRPSRQNKTKAFSDMLLLLWKGTYHAFCDYLIFIHTVHALGSKMWGYCM